MRHGGKVCDRLPSICPPEGAGWPIKRSAGGIGECVAGKSPSDPYLLFLLSMEACREGEGTAAVHGAGAILASCCPAVAPCPKYSVMSGGGDRGRAGGVSPGVPFFCFCAVCP